MEEWMDRWKVKVLVTQSCLILCNPMDCSPPGSSVHGILQARILEWVTMPSSRDLPDPEIKPCLLLLCRWILYHWATQEAHSIPRKVVLFFTVYRIIGRAGEKRYHFQSHSRISPQGAGTSSVIRNHLLSWEDWKPSSLFLVPGKIYCLTVDPIHWNEAGAVPWKGGAKLRRE